MNADIFSIVQELAPRFGVHRVRLTCEPAWPMFITAGLGHAIRRTNHIKWLLLRWLARGLSPQLPTTEAFFGVLHSGTISKPVLMELLRGLSPGRSNEICIHPGFPAPTAQTISGNPTAPDRFATSRFRQSEHDALIDPEAAEIVRRRGLTLMSFTGAIKEPI